MGREGETADMLTVISREWRRWRWRRADQHSGSSCCQDPNQSGEALHCNPGVTPSTKWIHGIWLRTEGPQGEAYNKGVPWPLGVGWKGHWLWIRVNQDAGWGVSEPRFLFHFVYKHLILHVAEDKVWWPWTASQDQDTDCISPMWYCFVLNICLYLPRTWKKILWFINHLLFQPSMPRA